MKRYMLNLDVAIELYADSEEKALEQAEDFINQTHLRSQQADDAGIFSVQSTAVLFGPEEVEEEPDEDI